MRQESILEHMKSNNIEAPKDMPTQGQANAKGGLVDEYKQKLSHKSAELLAAKSDCQAKNKKLNELQAQMKRDEGVLKKAIEENQKLKREQKRGGPIAPATSAGPRQAKSMVVPDADEIKERFMDKISSKLESMFEASELTD